MDQEPDLLGHRGFTVTRAEFVRRPPGIFTPAAAEMRQEGGEVVVVAAGPTEGSTKPKPYLMTSFAYLSGEVAWFPDQTARW